MARVDPRQHIPGQAGPWDRVIDSLDSSTSSDEAALQFLSDAQNMYPDPQFGSWVGRPGWSPTGNGLTATGLQLGSSGKRTVQGGTQWVKRGASGVVTRYTVVVVGGRFYVYDPGTNTYSEPQTATDLTAKSITLDASSRVYFIVIANTLFVHDGVNIPFTWDGSTGGGTGAGLVKLTNCPVLYGQPVVYYAKVVAIKNADRGRLLWSEENDPTIGYETAPYNNFWNNPGSQDANPLYGLVATNDALYVYRERSVTSITGRIDTQFATTAVRNDVSNTIGVESSATLIIRDSTIFFTDADGRLRYHNSTAMDDSLWREARQTIVSTVNTGALGVGDSVLFDDLVLMGFPEIGQSQMSALMVINTAAASPHFCGVWRGWGAFTRLWSADDQFGNPYVMRGDANGYVFRLGVAEAGPYSDTAFDGTSTAISHTLKTHYIGADTETEKQFVRTDLVLRAQTAATVGVGYVVPRTQSTPLTVAVAGGGATYGSGTYGSIIYGGGTKEIHRSVGHGQNANGRWMQVVLTHEMVNEQLGVQNLTTKYVQASRQPRTP